jgi:hypothetical protein
MKIAVRVYLTYACGACTAHVSAAGERDLRRYAEAHDTHHPLGIGRYYEDQKAAAKRRAD